MEECIFCNYNKSEIIAENKLAFAIMDKFPVNEGHTLIIPKRHFPFFFEATEEVKKVMKFIITLVIINVLEAVREGIK